MSLDVLRKAIESAMVGQDVDLQFNEHSVTIATLTVPQLRVSYQSGNEYMRLDRLLDYLRSVGTVEAFEFRGRGRSEVPTIVVDVRIDDNVVQLVYDLPT
jgi:hypothetical protein